MCGWLFVDRPRTELREMQREILRESHNLFCVCVFNMVTPRCECVCCFGGAFRIRLRRTSQRCVCACGCEVNTHEFTHIQLLCYNTAMDNPPKHRSNPIKRLVADHRSSQSQIAECKVRNRAMRIRVTSINYSHFPQTHTHTHSRVGLSSQHIRTVIRS